MINKDTFIFDIEGTLYENKSHPLRGAISLVATLLDLKKNVFFVSNTTSYLPQEIHKLLLSMGFSAQIKENHIYTGLSLLSSYIVDHTKNPLLLVDKRIENTLTQLLPCYKDQSPISDYDAVIVGNAKDLFTYDQLNKALNVLVKNDVPLVTCSKARKYSVGKGLFAIDGGSYATLLEYASQKKAIVLGKPCADFFLKPLKDYGLSIENTVMIGDDIENDILGASQIGIDTILVKTGKASILKDSDLRLLSKTKIVDHLEDLVKELTLS